jgi:glutamyl aminopeptidase
MNAVAMHEHDVRSYVLSQLVSKTPQILRDGLGSVFACFGTKGPLIQIAAHMDEVGALVKDFTPEGMITVHLVGGINNDMLVGQRLEIKTKNGYVPAVVGAVPPHIDSKTGELFVDAGATSKEELSQLQIEKGDQVSFKNDVFELANKKGFVSKAIDDRVGLGIVLEVVNQIEAEKLNCRLCIGGTVAEEVGLYGGQTASNAVKPDLFIAVDISPAGDTVLGGSAKLGSGVLIRHYDPRNIMPINVKRYITDLANKNKIKIQDFVSQGGTDAAAAQYANSGTVSITLGIAARYIHSPVTIVYYEDIDSLLKLLKTLIADFNDEKMKQIKVQTI